MGKLTDLETTLRMMGNSFESNLEQHADAIAELPIATQAVILNAMKSNSGMINMGAGLTEHATWDSLIVNSKGDLNITVTREGASIAAPLPFVLFGSNDFQSGYNTTLRTFVFPVGYTCTVSTDATTGDILFTYSNNTNTDVVRVHNEGSVNMRTFLASMNNNYFKTKNFLVSISDEAYNVQQFGLSLFFGVLSALGLTGANQLIFRSRTNSWQFRKDRVEVLLPEQKVVPEYSFAMEIIAVDAFNMGFDFFMSERYNLNNTTR